jgi:hypothetical protein
MGRAVVADPVCMQIANLEKAKRVFERMVKKQQMRWTERGARLLLQVRTRVLNQEWRSTLSRLYP